MISSVVRIPILTTAQYNADSPVLAAVLASRRVLSRSAVDNGPPTPALPLAFSANPLQASRRRQQIDHGGKPCTSSSGGQ